LDIVPLKIRLPAAHAPAWALAESVAAAAFSLVSMLVIGRVIGPNDIGVAMVAIAAFLTIDVFTASMFPDSLVQRAKLEPCHSESAATASMLLGGILGIGLATLGPMLAARTSVPEAGWLMLALAPLLPLSAFSGTVSGLYLREKRFRLLALRLLVGQPVALSIGLILAYAGYGPWAVIVSQMVSTVVTFTLMLRGGVSLKLRIDVAALRELWPVAGPQVAGVVVLVGRYRIFLLALSLLVTPNVLALSHFAFRMLDAALGIVSQTVTRIALPRLCALQHDRAAMANAYGDLAQLQALLGLPICIGIALTAPDLVQLLLGPSWAGMAEATRVVAGAAACTFLYGSYTTLFVALGKATRNFYIAVATLALPLIALVVLRPQTPEAVALTWAIPSLALPPVLVWLVLRELQQSPLWLARKIGPGVLASGLMALAVLLVQSNITVAPLLRFVTSIAVGGMVFSGFAWLTLRGRMPRALVA
jgi:O-antigen/teichoic acid export membrane protein